MWFPLPPSPPVAPPGFRVATIAELGVRPTRYKAWHVASAGGRLRVETSREYEDRRDEEIRVAGWPQAELSQTDEGPYSARPVVALRVSDGWLYGYDAGEWGGQLRWVSASGDRSAAIDEAQTDFLVRTRRGVFAVQSLGFPILSAARLIRVDRVAGRWTPRRVTDLYVPPLEVAQDRERFVYVTEEFVSTLETDGSQHELFRDPGRPKFRSIAAMPSGDLWIGAEGALLHLAPRPNGQSIATWFIPTASSTSNSGS